MKKVRVRWTDSTSWHGWKERDAIEKWVNDGPDDMESVGYLYKKNKKVVVLVQSLQLKHGSSVGENLMIPRVCVKDIKKLK
jgi:hypothetical protein